MGSSASASTSVPLGRARLDGDRPRTYKPVERILLVLSIIYFAYPISALLAQSRLETRDSRHHRARSSTIPTGYSIMIVGLVGTTITPWMQFYLQASIVEKGVTNETIA